MSLAIVLFNFYKKFNLFFKILFFPILIVVGALWVLGNFAHINTLIMWLIGVISGFTLFYIYNEQILMFIDKFIEMIHDFLMLW